MNRSSGAVGADQAFVRLLRELVGSITSAASDELVLGPLLEQTRDVFGASDAGMVLVRADGELAVEAATSADAQVLELLQVRAGEGPSVHALRSGEFVRCVDPAETARRWPGWASEASHRGYRAVMAVPLRAGDTTVGALTLLAGQSLAFAARQVEDLQLVANVIAVATTIGRGYAESMRLNAQLQQALDSRILIEQAKGVVAVQLGLSPDEAFGRIRDHARRNQIRLQEVTARIVRGELHLAAARRSAERRDARLSVREDAADRRDREADRREADLDRREEQVRGFVAAGDRRDHAASKRDQAARGRDRTADGRAEQDRALLRDNLAPDYEAGLRASASDRSAADIDRDWSARDRDDAAGDRAELAAEAHRRPAAPAPPSERGAR